MSFAFLLHLHNGGRRTRSAAWVILLGTRISLDVYVFVYNINVVCICIIYLHSIATCMLPFFAATHWAASATWHGTIVYIYI